MMYKIKKLFHNYLHWGFPAEKRGGDGFQPVYECEFCQQDICQDSQGNWFHLFSK